MNIDIITLFPAMFRGPFDESIIKRAKDRKLVEINIHYLRDWAEGRHQIVDDRPFGGGVGMVLMIEPIFKAIEKLRTKESKVILMTPQGEQFNQNIAQELSHETHLIFLAGHYEGYDERIREHLVDREISIGDYVLTGGELPVMVIVDTVVRLIPGVLNKEEAIQFESFSKLDQVNSKLDNILEYPHYTRPAEFKGWEVPEVLLSGNHAEIEKWRQEKALEKTKKRRPDLLKKQPQ